MPYNPALPADHSPNSSAEMRGQLNGLKDMHDALAANTITAVVVALTAPNTMLPCPGLLREICMASGAAP